VIKLLTDEHISKRLIRGLLLREPELDLVRMQDVGLRTGDDASILAWAAQEGRVLITSDASTIPDIANERLARGQPMSGVILLRSDLSIGQAIEELRVSIGASFPGEWEGRVLRLPL
jgi:predicted nuclease of predicted toxin-antitoxin system